MQSYESPRQRSAGATCICTTSSSAEPVIVFGHENQGVVEKVGKGVVSIKPADRVVLPFNISCGFCFNCARGFTNACLTANPEAPTAGYGYTGMGSIAAGKPNSCECLLRISTV